MSSYKFQVYIISMNSLNLLIQLKLYIKLNNAIFETLYGIIYSRLSSVYIPCFLGIKVTE